jgi:hypothetical protein
MTTKVPQAKRTARRLFSLLSALEACERANPIQINAEVRPEETGPSEPCNRITPDEYREEPELLTVVQPNVCVAEQASSDPPRVDGKSGNRHLRYELRWRGRRRLNASRCTSRRSWSPRKSSGTSTWNPRSSRSSRHARSARETRKSSAGSRCWKKSHI